MSLTTSSAIATENKNQQKDTTSITKATGKTKWVQEPSSFMGIELNQALSTSVFTECPVEPPILSESNNKELQALLDRIQEVDMEQVAKLEKLCYLLGFSNDPTYDVYGLKVLPLNDHAWVNTLTGTLDGAVGLITISFESREFSSVMQMLTVRYGSPHKKNTEKLKTNGGAEFNNTVLSWSGKNVLITLESLSERFVSGSGTLNEVGKVKVYTNKYLTLKSHESQDAARKAAAGL